MILFRVLANAVALHIPIRECQDNQQTHHALVQYTIPDDLGIDYAIEQQHFEVCTII